MSLLRLALMCEFPRGRRMVNNDARPCPRPGCTGVMVYGRHRERQEAGRGKDPVDGEYVARARVKGWKCPTCGHFEAD